MMNLAGILVPLGCGMMVSVFALQSVPAAMIHVQADVFQLLSENARIIAILSLLVSGSIIVIFNVLVDIMGMKMVMRRLNWKKEYRSNGYSTKSGQVPEDAA